LDLPEFPTDFVHGFHARIQKDQKNIVFKKEGLLPEIPFDNSLMF